MTSEEAQNRLKVVISGEELAITQDGETVAVFTRALGEHAPRAPRRPGDCKGTLTIASDDDDHFEDWEEHAA